MVQSSSSSSLFAFFSIFSFFIFTLPASYFAFALTFPPAFSYMGSLSTTMPHYIFST